MVAAKISDVIEEHQIVQLAFDCPGKQHETEVSLVVDRLFLCGTVLYVGETHEKCDDFKKDVLKAVLVDKRKGVGKLVCVFPGTPNRGVSPVFILSNHYDEKLWGLNVICLLVNPNVRIVTCHDVPFETKTLHVPCTKWCD